jgi:hypothetical protein
LITDKEGIMKDVSLVGQLHKDVFEIQTVNFTNAVEVSARLSETKEFFEKLSTLYHVEKDPVTGEYHNYLGGVNGNMHTH